MPAVSKSKARQYFNYDLMRGLCIALVVIGVLTILQGIGVIFLICAGAVWYFGMRETPTDQDIEDTFSAAAVGQESAAMAALHFAKNDLIRPSDWFWFVSQGIPGQRKRLRKGKDKVERANTRCFLLVFYGPDQIMSYQIDYNVETGATGAASTSEYFYRDVAGIEVDDKSLTLRTSGGLKAFPLHEKNEAVDRARATNVMNAIRAMLREKKGSQ